MFEFILWCLIKEDRVTVRAIKSNPTLSFFIQSALTISTSLVILKNIHLNLLQKANDYCFIDLQCIFNLIFVVFLVPFLILKAMEFEKFKREITFDPHSIDHYFSRRVYSN